MQPTVNAGEPIDYELKVTNHGLSDATGIVVTDRLPTATTFVSSDPGCAEAGRIVTCELPELKVGEAHTFHLEVEVKSGTTGFIENTAEVEGDQPDPEPANEESTVENADRWPRQPLDREDRAGKPALLGNISPTSSMVENQRPLRRGENRSRQTAAVPGEIRQPRRPASVPATKRPPGSVTCELGTCCRKRPKSIRS